MDLTDPFVEAAILVPFMILCVRLAGLRAFSKMSSYDFAVTIAFGSVLGGTVLGATASLGQGMLALTALFVVQWLIGAVRSRLSWAEDVLDNVPVLLMADGIVLEKNLAAVRVTKSDLQAKLREANVLDYGSVRAVVMETTGDVSVLHGDHLDTDLIDDVMKRPAI